MWVFKGNLLSYLFSNLQIWHQLKSRNSKHSIVAHEDSFFLAVQEGKTLSISEKYSFSNPAHSLSVLIFFIVHSLIDSEQNDLGEISGADALQTIPSVLHDNPGGFNYPSGFQDPNLLDC